MPRHSAGRSYGEYLAPRRRTRLNAQPMPTRAACSAGSTCTGSRAASAWRGSTARKAASRGADDLLTNRMRRPIVSCDLDGSVCWRHAACSKRRGVLDLLCHCMLKQQRHALIVECDEWWATLQYFKAAVAQRGTRPARSSAYCLATPRLRRALTRTRCCRTSRELAAWWCTVAQQVHAPCGCFCGEL